MKDKLKSIILSILILLAPHISVVLAQCVYSNYVEPAYSTIMTLNFISIELSIFLICKNFTGGKNEEVFSVLA